MSDKIEGVPEGWRLVRISKWPKVGEYAIYSPGEIVMVNQPDQWDLACIVEKIVKYRDVTPDDIGKMVEIDIGGYWCERKLLAILPDEFKGRYIVETAGGNDWNGTDKARIKD